MHNTPGMALIQIEYIAEKSVVGIKRFFHPLAKIPNDQVFKAVKFEIKIQPMLVSMSGQLNNNSNHI